MFTPFMDYLRKRPASVYWMCIVGILLWIIARQFAFASNETNVSFVPMLCILGVAATNLCLRKAVSSSSRLLNSKLKVGWIFAFIDFSCIVLGLRFTGALQSPLWVVTFVVVAGETILEDRLVATLTRLVACIALLIGTLPTPLETNP